MSPQVIPAEAAEAAAKVIFERNGGRWGNWTPEEKAEELEDMRAALEAAAPHMTRAAQERAWDEGDYANYKDRNPYRKSPDA